MTRVKYPSTPHLPFSADLSSDDKYIRTLAGLIDQEVVVTEKLDGENTTMYSDHIHARSVDSRHHPSRDWVKMFWAQRRFLIPEGYRICGENVYAQHSIRYDNLESYFYGFSVWDKSNVALDWDETIQYFENLQIEPVPVLYRGKFDLKILEDLAKSMDTSIHEGFVVRTTGRVPYSEFDTKFAKWVRK